jgi:hypothetical protein
LHLAVEKTSQSSATKEQPEDKQLQYELARGYKDHIDAVKADRELEDWMQDMALP